MADSDYTPYCLEGDDMIYEYKGYEQSKRGRLFRKWAEETYSPTFFNKYANPRTVISYEQVTAAEEFEFRRVTEGKGHALLEERHQGEIRKILRPYELQAAHIAGRTLVNDAHRLESGKQALHAQLMENVTNSAINARLLNNGTPLKQALITSKNAGVDVEVAAQAIMDGYQSASRSQGTENTTGEAAMNGVNIAQVLRETYGNSEVEKGLLAVISKLGLP